MQFASYIVVNIICIALSIIVYSRLRQDHTINSTAQVNMKMFLYALCALCVSDCLAVILRGKIFPGANVLLEIVNLIYIDAGPLISMYWLLYVYSKIGTVLTKKQSILWRIPSYLFILFSLTNPFTHLLFLIDENNLYSRGPLIFVHWIISFSQMLLAAILSWKAMRKTDSWVKRSEYRTLLGFFILPTLGAIAQILFYGVATLQVGIILSVILITMQMQDSKITLDELTGVNNRKSLRQYVENIAQRNSNQQMLVLMIDVNHFKKINDTYGHAVGDIVLCKTADTLKRICEKSKDHLFLSRYGGDEFIIVGKDFESRPMDEYMNLIQQEFNETNKDFSHPIAISIGYALGVCKSYTDFEKLLTDADEIMYENKKVANALRVD